MSRTTRRARSPARGVELDGTPSSGTTLWVGGSSALARTYFEELHPNASMGHVIVAAPRRPDVIADGWCLPADVSFVELDLLCHESVRTLISRLPSPGRVDALVLSVRLSLVWSRAEDHERLAEHVGDLVRVAASCGCKTVMHVSSIAVADHVTPQHLISESEPTPPADALPSAYDRFKARSEAAVDGACAGASGVRAWTHLRISGIFSNDPRCIQCTAVRRQARLGLRQQEAIDFNSSRNVCHAIALVLGRHRTGGARGPRGRAVFYYTRPAGAPVPYWRHVDAYRRAHRVRIALWLPRWLADGTIRHARAAARVLGRVAASRLGARLAVCHLARALEYLLAVASTEHTADNRAFRAAFPQIDEREETIEQAFERIARNAARRPSRKP